MISRSQRFFGEVNAQCALPSTLTQWMQDPSNFCVMNGSNSFQAFREIRNRLATRLLPSWRNLLFFDVKMLAIQPQMERCGQSYVIREAKSPNDQIFCEASGAPVRRVSFVVRNIGGVSQPKYLGSAELLNTSAKNIV